VAVRVDQEHHVDEGLHVIGTVAFVPVRSDAESALTQPPRSASLSVRASSRTTPRLKISVCPYWYASSFVVLGEVADSRKGAEVREFERCITAQDTRWGDVKVLRSRLGTTLARI
jgi:hypothetical protein